MNLDITVVSISLGVAFFGICLLAAIAGRKRRWRDPQRLFTWEQKQHLVLQAGGRCEHKHPLWFRCAEPGSQADHVIPWSRGGPTELWNGQLLCRRHNRQKSSWMPTRLYRSRLTCRRRRYPQGDHP